MSADRGEQGKKRARPRRVRRALLLLVGLAALALAALLFARDPLIARYGIPRVIALVEQSSGLLLTVGSFETSATRLVLRDVDVRSSAADTIVQSATVRTLTVELSVLDALISGSRPVSRVIVDGVDVVLDTTQPRTLPVSDPDEPPPETASPRVPLDYDILPDVLVRDGGLRLLTPAGELRVGGVLATVRGDRIEAEILERSGDLLPELLAAAPPTLVAAGRWESLGRDEPFGLELPTIVDSTGELFARGLEVRVHRTEGQLDTTVRVAAPGLGAEEVLVDFDNSASTVAITARLLDLELGDWATRLPGGAADALGSVGGRVRGVVRASVPVGDALATTVNADVIIHGLVRRTPPDLRVVDLLASVARASDGSIRGDAHAVGLAVAGSPDVDAFVSFSARALLEDEGAWRLRADDVAVSLDGEVAHARGAMDVSGDGLRDFSVEVESERLDLARVAAALLPALESPEQASGHATLRGFARGGAELASIEALADLGVTLDEEAECDAVRLAASPELRACVISSDHVSITRGDDHVALAVRSDLSPDAGVRLGPATGRVFDRSFEAGVIELVQGEASSWHLPPFAMRAVGADWTISASRTAAGVISFRVEERGLAIDSALLAEISPALVARLETWRPRGRLALSVAGDIGPEITETAGVWVDADAEILDGSISIGEATAAQPDRGRVPVHGRVSAQVSAEGATISLRELACGEDRLTATAFIPLHWEPAPLARSDVPATIDLEATVRNLVTYRLFAAEQLRSVGGTLTTRASVPLDESFAPRLAELRANVAMLQGSLRLHGYFPAIEGIRAQTSFRSGELRIERLSATIAGDPLEADGVVRFADLGSIETGRVERFDLALRGERTLLVRRPDLRARGDIDLTWRGDWERSRLEGRVEVVRAWYLQNVRLTGGGASVPFDLFRLEDAPFRGTELALEVVANKSIYVKNNVVNTRASADLELRGTGRLPALSGAVSTDEGRVVVGNQSLDIQSALVEFREADVLDPRLQIQLGKNIRGYDVTVSVEGTASSPEVLLESSPSLDNDRLLLLVTTGYTLDAIDEQGAGRVAAIEAAKYIGSNVAAYIFRGSDPTKDSFFDRLSVETRAAEHSYQEDLIRIEFQVVPEVRFTPLRDHIFVQGERDYWGDYNVNVGWRFEVD